MWGIIGGTGFENFEEFVALEEFDRSTPFGEASSGLKRVRIGETEAIFVSRHGRHHELTPSEVNYRANVFAFKKLGVKRLLAISAVGSLRAELQPGSLVIPDQYIDRTKGVRKSSFCGDGVVGHVSLAEPVPLEYLKWLDGHFLPNHKFAFPIHTRRVSVVIEGPYFSTRAESFAYRGMGADIIGMTNFPECGLAREAGIAYFPLSFVTDYDCWKQDEEHVTVEQVMKVMKQNNKNAFEFVSKLVHSDGVPLSGGVPELGLRSGLMTKPEALSESTQSWLQVLTG